MPEVKNTPLNIYSATDVQHWIEARKKSEKFRGCAHLKTMTHKKALSWGTWRVEFLPWCERLSFKWGTDTYGDLDMQRQLLAEYLSRREDLISCPANCAFYENERWAAWKQRFAAVWKLRGYLAVPFRWFHSLAWQIQLAFIVLAIVALAPKWVPQIVILLKAFHGQ